MRIGLIFLTLLVIILMAHFAEPPKIEIRGIEQQRVGLPEPVGNESIIAVLKKLNASVSSPIPEGSNIIGRVAAEQPANGKQ